MDIREQGAGLKMIGLNTCPSSSPAQNEQAPLSTSVVKLEPIQNLDRYKQN